MVKKQKALDVQVDGSHYKSGAIQPVEFLESQPNIPFTIKNVIKYSSRLGLKGKTAKERKAQAVIDLAKIRHYLDLYEELEHLRK